MSIIGIIIAIVISSTIALIINIILRLILYKPKVISGTINPTTEGSNGDFYINTSTNTLFGPKSSGIWPLHNISLIGPTGDRGSIITSGSLDPTINNPVDNNLPLLNDLHIDETGGIFNLYKYDGSNWILKGSLKETVVSNINPRAWIINNILSVSNEFPANGVARIIKNISSGNFHHEGVSSKGTGYFEIVPTNTIAPFPIIPVNDDATTQRVPAIKILKDGTYKISASISIANSVSGNTSYIFTIRKSSILDNPSIIDSADTLTFKRADVAGPSSSNIDIPIITIADLSIGDYITLHITNNTNNNSVFILGVNFEIVYYD